MSSASLHCNPAHCIVNCFCTCVLEQPRILSFCEPFSLRSRYRRCCNFISDSASLKRSSISDFLRLYKRVFSDQGSCWRTLDIFLPTKPMQQRWPCSFIEASLVHLFLSSHSWPYHFHWSIVHPSGSPESGIGGAAAGAACSVVAAASGDDWLGDWMPAMASMLSSSP